MGISWESLFDALEHIVLEVDFGAILVPQAAH